MLFFPSIRICPLVCLVSLQRICARVAFLAPFCPVMMVTLPWNGQRNILKNNFAYFFREPCCLQDGRAFVQYGGTKALSSKGRAQPHAQDVCFPAEGVNPPVYTGRYSAVPDIKTGLRSPLASRSDARDEQGKALCLELPKGSRKPPCPAASRLAVGLSHTKTFGFMAYTDAMAARCFSPLERMSTALSFKTGQLQCRMVHPSAPVSPGWISRTPQGNATFTGKLRGKELALGS